MTNPKRPKCRSNVVPCPAGDRCPEHRGRSAAIINALKESNIPEALLLKKEELDKKEKTQLAAFVETMSLKFKKDGSTIVTLNNDKKNQIRIDPIHPASAVDKTHRIVPNRQIHFTAGTIHKTQDQQMQEALDEIYDGSVQLETSNNHGFVGIDKLNIADEYKGHGVESHVLASLVVERRHDLYNFASKADLPHAEYIKAGFEPNPYYFAGQKHPETGQSFPSTSDLDKFSNDRENPNHWEYSYHDLWAARDAAAYPYLRLKYGHRLSETPLRKDPVDPKQVAKIREARGERWDRAQAARSSRNILDLH